MSEQTGDHAVFVDIDLFCRGNLGKSGHRHDISRERYYKACTGADLKISDCNIKSLRSTFLCLIVGETVLCLRDTYGKLIKSVLDKCFKILLGRTRKDNSVRVIYLCSDETKLFFDGKCFVIGICKSVASVFFLAKSDNLIGKFCRTLTAFCPSS